jgi:4-amino-4-deoxy-L-arabinose transferase-like glycosyltransferase
VFAVGVTGAARYIAGAVEARGRLLVGTLVGVVLLAGIPYSFYLGDHLPYIDEREYYAIAKNVAYKHVYSADGEHPNASRAPAYPLVLSLLVFLGAGVPALRVLNFVALALSIYLLYAMVRSLVSDFAGVVAAMLVVCYPVLFYAAGTLFPQTLGALLFVLVLFLLSRAVRTRSLVPVGLVFGCLLLTIPLFVFFLAVVVGWLLITRRERRIRSAVAVVVPAFLVAGVWTLRNYLVFGSFVLFTTGSGAALLWGNSEHATIGGTDVDFLIRQYAAAAAMNDVERSAYFTSEAVKAMLANRTGTIGFYFLKVLNHFSFYNQHYAAAEASWAKTVVMGLTYVPLLLLFIVRVARRKRYPLSAFEVLLAWLYVSSAFIYAIFHTRIRYRLPVDYALIALVAMFIGSWVGATLTRGDLGGGADRDVRSA